MVVKMNDYSEELPKLITLVSGAKKNDCALVIPSADAVEWLDKHLSMLEKQTTDRFDTIVIGKPPAQSHPKLNLIIFSENYPLGSSGGFGIGQVLAYSMGYEYIVNSDVDCLPVSTDLIAKLKGRAGAEQKIVLPLSVSFRGDKIDQIGGYVINQYGICTRRILEENGFLYFNFFKGSEDFEFGQRCLMENKVAFEDGVTVSHKNRIFDYIALLKFRGNKHIYYKRSLVAANILLASYALRKIRLFSAFRYAFGAWFEVLKTQLFYFEYPDITGPVYEALFLDLGRAIKGNNSKIWTIAQTPQMKRLSLRSGSGADAQTVFFAKGKAGASATVQVASNLAKIISSKADYLEVDNEFIGQEGGILPVLMFFKPIEYFDGSTYAWKAGWIGKAANIVFTAAMSLFAIFVIPFSICKAFTLKYPTRLENLGGNLEEFAKYVEQFGRLQG